jgi:integrase/recombinase XerD
MNTIRWEFYPHVAENPHARTWLETQMLLGLAQSTIDAYGRGANGYLAFCQRTTRPFLDATKADIVAYIDDMTHQVNPKGDNIRYLHSGVGLANSTMQQRLTVVRLLYDYLIDERLRLDQRNPVGKGKFTPVALLLGGENEGSCATMNGFHGCRGTMSGRRFLRRHDANLSAIGSCFFLPTTARYEGAS